MGREIIMSRPLDRHKPIAGLEHRPQYVRMTQGDDPILRAMHNGNGHAYTWEILFNRQFEPG